MLELIIKNCNGNIVTYEFNNKVDFIFKFDTVGFENNIPMLDDEIISLKIDNIDVENSNLIIVNDLYELLEENIKIN